jgi:prepilin-type N-terminal cleavage/methylation domain-containing protein
MKRHGFTVIELLIASVITSMVAAAVISTMQAAWSSRIWRPMRWRAQRVPRHAWRIT